VPRVVATLPRTNKPFLAAIDIDENFGRMVVIGDCFIFENKYFNLDDNQQLSLNIFRWLARHNPLECCNAQVKSEVRYGQTTPFSIVLKNPNKERLEHIECSLESDASVLIEEPSLLRIRSIPGDGQTQLQWNLKPLQLGSYNLRLTIDFPKESKHKSLFFDVAAQFKCIPDAEIDLVFLNHQGKIQEIVETGIPFEVKAVYRWEDKTKQIPLQLNLNCPLSHIRVEPIGDNHWRLTALDAGKWQLELEASEIDRRIIRLIHAYPSAKTQIEAIEQNVVAPLAAEVHRQVSQIRQEFDSKVIRNISFRLFTPEDLVILLYSSSKKEQRLEAIQAARCETQDFFPLVERLLEFIAPTYSPLQGCCIPYDPKLAAHLAKEHPLYKEQLAYNFLCLDGNERYGQVWLEGNIAALLLHEKYGHGFFYTQTTVGRQLVILYRHGFLGGVEREGFKSPYRRSLQQEYSSASEALHDSTLILNEGFAAWMELTVLPRLTGIVSQAVYRRKDFLFNYDEYLKILAKEAKEKSYFKDRLKPFYGSRYQEGYEYLEEIQSDLGSECGTKCAVQAMIKAADVDFGITERNGQIHFGLTADKLEKALLDKQEGDDALTHIRLKRIQRVLSEYADEIRRDQERLQCHRCCLHRECPVDRIINEHLGW
jgi:hypothetical protein